MIQYEKTNCKGPAHLFKKISVSKTGPKFRTKKQIP
jgi:hypothetical protein